MKRKQEIIVDYLINGLSQREISRKYGISRNTIKKYIADYNDSRSELVKEGISFEKQVELTADISEKPKYNTQSRQKAKLTNEIIEIIKGYLAKNEDKKSKGIHKQLMKAVDIHEELTKDGFDISYSTVSNIVRELKNKSKEAYIRQEYSFGEVCEFDWGEVKLYINNDKFEVFQMGTFTSAKGNYRYARLYRTQKMECFLDMHAKFFEHIGGCYKTVVYDNMKVAVRKFVSKTEKEPTEDLLKLSLYYGFKYRFCNARKGNEKGHVERSVEYIRRKAFAKRDTFTSFEEAQQYLQSELARLNNLSKKMYDGKSPLDLLKEEKEFLGSKMPPYQCHRVTESRVDKYSTISVDQKHYSVQDHCVGQFVTTFIYIDRIVCYHKNKEVATHHRLYGNYKWSLSIFHYTKTLSKKPGALLGSRAFKQSSRLLQEIYESYYTENPKDFIVLLEYIKNVGLEKVLSAISELQKLTPLDISTDKIKMISERRQESASEACAGNHKLIEASKNNINRIIAIYGIQTTNYEKESIL